MTEIRSAATVLLLRDGQAGLEVLMVEHHRNVGGSLVFPGGKIEASDADPRFLARSRGLHVIDEGRRGTWVAALRETFEEAGILLARKSGDQELIGRDAVDPLQDFRSKVVDGDLPFHDLLEAHDLELAADMFVHFAHWNTPEFVKRPLAVHFLISQAPADQDARHDGWESVDSIWTRPSDALDAAESGKSKVAFPTRMVLRRLQKSRDVDAAMSEARSVRVEPMQTEVVQTDGGAMARTPRRSGFEATFELMESGTT